MFFPLLKTVLNSSILVPFSASAGFCFTSSTSANVSLWRLFSSGETKISCSESKIRWIGRVGHGGHAVFGQKLLNTQCGVGRCAGKSLIMKWVNTLKESSKTNSLKPNSASHNNANWYTNTDGFLEHSPSGGSLYYKGPTLQRIILFSYYAVIDNRTVIITSEAWVVVWCHAGLEPEVHTQLPCPPEIMLGRTSCVAINNPCCWRGSFITDGNIWE